MSERNVLMVNKYINQQKVVLIQAKGDSDMGEQK